MKLLLLTLFVGLGFSFAAATQTGPSDEAILIVVSNKYSDDQLFAKALDENITLIRFLKTDILGFGRIALVKQSSLTKVSAKALGVLFTLNAFGLKGCGNDQVPEPDMSLYAAGDAF